ncbi:MAG: trehalose-phosphatase [Candidatus Omnitrophica bacterium]|nr:trehalose-phosphatase [Candidatus Omnitrophota bacterium]
MKNLLLNIAEWRERLEHDPLAVFLDYDGTLSAIAPTPSEAKLPFATQEILKALVKIKNVKVGIISGRSLSDLRKTVQVSGLTFVGSHGMEIQSEGIASKRVSNQYMQELRELRCRLKGEVRDLSGILLELKPFSLAIHYRKASSGDEKRVKRIVLDICNDAVHQGSISIMSGKKVIEIMPPTAMDKGQAVEKLLKLWGRKKVLPVFIGDDRTDEAAFEVLQDRGLTIRVGESDAHSHAAYYLDSVDDVRTFLRMILCFRISREGVSHDSDAE